MKSKYTTRNVIVASIASALLILSCSCHNNGNGGNGSPTPSGTPVVGGGFTDTLITTGTSVAVSTYLGTISDSTRCHAISNLASGIAGTLRTVTGNPPPTAAQLSTAIIAQIPANLQAQYPEVVAFVVPLVVQGYQYAVQQYGNSNQQEVYQILNDIATGVETGTASGCSH